MTSLPVTVVTTHAHWDHIGGHRYYDNIAVHEAEREWLSGSYALREGQDRYEEFAERLLAVFDRHSAGEQIVLGNKSVVYSGKIL